MNYRMWLAGIGASTLLAPMHVAAEEGRPLAATVEVGAVAIDVQDDIKKVNEYTVFRDKSGVNPYGKVDLKLHKNGVVVDVNSRFMDAVDQDHKMSLDANRVFRTSFSYSVLQHWLSHDQLNYMDATIPPASSYNGAAAAAAVAGGGTPPPLTPESVPGFWYVPNAGTTTPAYGGNSATAPAGYTAQQIGRASVYGEDLTPDAVFKIKRTELISKSDLTLPQLPNLTFHFKFRNEDRNGMEQSIGMSKCTSCHVTGQSRSVDENTRDITAGVTGKFGLLTLDYSFTNREFREDAAAPTMTYDPALSPGAAAPGTYNTGGVAPFDNRLLFDYRNGALRFDETPDSEKDTHVLKAKVDLPEDTTVVASYVNSTVKSGKSAESGMWSFNGANNRTLTSEYDSYGARLTKLFGKKLTVTVQGRAEKIKDDDVALSFDTLPLATTAANTNFGTAPNQFVPTAASLSPTRYSSLTRDTFKTGIEAMYRLAPRTTVRLGYDYELVDREHEFGETKTHTVKASFNARPTRTLSTRGSLSYKDIDDPFHNPHAALTPITDNTGSTVGNGLTYGISLYDERTADLTNLPEQVIDGNLSATWTPSARYSVSANYRVKSEENDLNASSWQQLTHGPGVSAWYAPNDRVNVTFAYNYLNQTSETAFCQGWYDG